ncbi:MAG: hypothetical protein ACTSYM_04410 [Candidatus Baldrarchaeia archaeon]
MVKKRCRFCSEKTVTVIKYSGLPLCREHFIEYFEKRALKPLKNIR